MKLSEKAVKETDIQKVTLGRIGHGLGEGGGREGE